MSAAQFEAERAEYQSQLELVIGSLREDPENAELQGLRGELEQMISLIDDSLAELKPTAANTSTSAPTTTTTTTTRTQSTPSTPVQAEEKWSRDKHPAFKKDKDTVQAPDEEKVAEVVVNYQVNDNVMARWLSGDKGYYPARITSVTGSSTAPIYTVKFKSYDTVETLRGKDIRPVAAGQKRKAEDTQPTTTHTPGLTPPRQSSANNGIVLSAGPDLYTQHQQQQMDGAGGAAGDEKRPKAKKIKASKVLEAGKNKWQEFTTKGKFGKAAKKDSMFRTPEGIHGRVGFTGSGQAMRKDPTRSRHVYQPNEDVD